jgi:hypothetical protein
MKKLIILFFISLFLSVNHNSLAQNKSTDKILNRNISSRFSYLLDFPVDSLAIPRSVNISNGVFKKIKSKDWTSGFFPGTLWQIYKLTGDVKFKEKAAVWNAFIEKEKFNGTTHDIATAYTAMSTLAYFKMVFFGSTESLAYKNDVVTLAGQCYGNSSLSQRKTAGAKCHA